MSEEGKVFSFKAPGVDWQYTCPPRHPARGSHAPLLATASSSSTSSSPPPSSPGFYRHHTELIQHLLRIISEDGTIGMSSSRMHAKLQNTILCSNTQSRSCWQQQGIKLTFGTTPPYKVFSPHLLPTDYTRTDICLIFFVRRRCQADPCADLLSHPQFHPTGQYTAQAACGS